MVEIVLDAAAWVVEQFGGVALGDARRRARAVAIGAGPGALKAVYRLLDEEGT